jgi:hypothetical protein
MTDITTWSTCGLFSHLNRKPDRLAAAQLKRFAPVLAALEDRALAEAGFDATLAEWRVESARSTIRFLEGLATTRADTAGHSDLVFSREISERTCEW